MLTLLSNVTQNPAAHESEAGVIFIYCCLAASEGEKRLKYTPRQLSFLASVKWGVIAFRLIAQWKANEDG